MSMATRTKRGIIHLIMTAYMIIIVFPLLWMLISGFKSNSEIFGSPWSFPSSLNPKNYIYAWLTYIQRATLNSLFFTILGTVLTVLIAVSAVSPTAAGCFKGITRKEHTYSVSDELQAQLEKVYKKYNFTLGWGLYDISGSTLREVASYRAEVAAGTVRLGGRG